MYSQLKKYYTGAALNGGWAMPLQAMNSATVPSAAQLNSLGNSVFNQTNIDAQDKITKAQAKYGATWDQVYLCLGLLFMMDSYALKAATDRDYSVRQLCMQRARALKNVYGHVVSSTIFRRIRSIFHNNKSGVMGLAADQGPYAPFSSRLVPSIGKYYRYMDGDRKMKLMRGLSWNVPSLISSRHASVEAARKKRMKDLWTAINANRAALGLPAAAAAARKGPVPMGAMDPRWAQVFSLANYPAPVEKDVAFDPFAGLAASPASIPSTPVMSDGNPTGIIRPPPSGQPTGPTEVEEPGSTEANGAFW